MQKVLTSQARYHRRKRRGLVMVHPVVDPQEIVSLLHHAGLHVLGEDRENLAAGIEETSVLGGGIVRNKNSGLNVKKLTAFCGKIARADLAEG